MLGYWQRRNRCSVRFAERGECATDLPSQAAGEGRRLRGARDAGRGLPEARENFAVQVRDRGALCPNPTTTVRGWDGTKRAWQADDLGNDALGPLGRALLLPYEHDYHECDA